MVHFILFNLFSEKFILLSFPQNSVFTSPAERIHFSSRAYLLPFPQNSVFTSPAERIHFSSRAYLLPQMSVFTSPAERVYFSKKRIHFSLCCKIYNLFFLNWYRHTNFSFMFQLYCFR